MPFPRSCRAAGSKGQIEGVAKAPFVIPGKKHCTDLMQHLQLFIKHQHCDVAREDAVQFLDEIWSTGISHPGQECRNPELALSKQTQLPSPTNAVRQNPLEIFWCVEKSVNAVSMESAMRIKSMASLLSPVPTPKGSVNSGKGNSS